MDNISKTILPGGIKVVSEFVPHLRSFSLGFWFDTGSRNETHANNGISHFTEHMLFKGTKNRSQKRISDDIESLGGYLNAFTTKEHTCYYGRGLTNHFEKTLEVLADMVQHSLFRERDIKKESSVIIDELYDIEDNAEELIFDKFEMELFKGNPIAMPIIGTENNLKTFKHRDFIDYLNNYYTADNLTIALSGAVEHNRLVRLVEKCIKDFKEKSARKNKKVKLKKTSDIIIKKDIQQSHFIIGSPTYGIKDKERPIVSILMQILGEGSSSRLFQVLREQNGITYQVNSFYNSFFDISSAGVYFSTNDKSFEKAQILTIRELEKLKTKKVTSKELKRAKESMLGSLLMSMESTTNRMNRLAHSEIYFNRYKPIEEVEAEIKAVSEDDVLKMAEDIFDENKLLRVSIIPE